MIYQSNTKDNKATTSEENDVTDPNKSYSMCLDVIFPGQLNIFQRIEYHDYLERVRDRLVLEQQNIIEGIARDDTECVSSGTFIEIRDLDFLQYKSRANAARKIMRIDAPCELLECMFKLTPPDIETVEGLQEEIDTAADRLEIIRAEILSTRPVREDEANAKLHFVSRLLLGARPVDMDEIAFVLAECLALHGRGAA